MATLYVNVAADCEATQPAIGDAELGERAVRGMMGICAAEGGPGTFFVIPSDLAASPGLYREAEAAGWEIGLHVHPAAQGHAHEFLGVYGPEDQRRILEQAVATFEEAMGRRPATVCLGYGSANDFTYGVIEELGFTHGQCSVPRRVLPECASVWAGAPLDMHYPHRYNRVLTGDVNFVEMPDTVDPDSMMWGGKHPQDLRVELVDAKNHWYTMDKAIRRQVDSGEPVALLRVVTHNIFEYGEPADFRRETLVGILRHAGSLAESYGLDLEFATLARVNTLYRAARPHAEAAAQTLDLDRRGHGGPG